MAAALPVKAGVVCVQAECTWVIDSFTRRFKAVGSTSPTAWHETESAGFRSTRDGQQLRLLMGNSCSNMQYCPDYFVELTLDPSQVGRNLYGFLTMTSADDVGSAAPRAISVNVCVIDAGNAKALETIAEISGYCYSGEGYSNGSAPSSTAYKFELPADEIMSDMDLYTPQDELRVRATVSLKPDQVCSPLVSSSSASRLMNLSKEFQTFLASGVGSDFQIVCDSESFHVHKAILAARSPVFASMLTTDMKEKKEKVLVQEECDPKVIKILLEYVYSSEIKIEALDIDTVCKLVKAADKYQLIELKDICFTHLIKNLNLQTAGHITIIAYLHSAAKEVRNEIFGYCVRNWQNLASNAAFQAVHTEWPKAFHKPE